MEHWLIDFLRSNFNQEYTLKLCNQLENRIQEVPFLEDPMYLIEQPHNHKHLRPYLIITTTGLPLIAMCHPVLCSYWLSIHTVQELAFAIHIGQVKYISRDPLPFSLAEIRPYPHYQNLSLLALAGNAPLTKGQIEAIEAEEKVRQVLENYLTPKHCHSEEI